MSHRFILGLLLLLNACATHRAPLVSPSETFGMPAGSPMDITRAEKVHALARSLQEGQDYSPRGLFQKAHGDFIEDSTRYTPTAQIAGLHQPTNGFNHYREGDFDLSELSFEMTTDPKNGFATVVGPDTAILVGGHAASRHYKSDLKKGGSVVKDETVYEFSIDIGVHHFVDENLMISGTFSPGAYSDFDRTLTTGDWQFLGSALVTYRQTEDMFVKAGVVVSRDFDDAPVYPVVGFSWLMPGDMRVDVLFPQKAEVSWLASPTLVLHVGLELEGNEYSVRSGGSRFVLHAQEARAVFGGIYRINDRVSLIARTGAALFGDYDIPASDGKEIGGALDPAFFAMVGIGIDF
ncbi:MAG: DUF6268 family outer membrane beta-barrel protein [Planctomycetota bacterium]|nr:DUF6268 family outer membrane beta-barrel protein [Planctomycetota bacterium]